ncbi:tyrosine aminotransferase [Kwoniella newhampshirensis]|uniref:Tyrosine aminotransferase n=1 Tax=Kwoniella newhampshirensis TaxID=1651941 RepID=A0AAW0YD18_9TREE
MPDITLLHNDINARVNVPFKTKTVERQWNIRAAPAVARSRNPIRETLASITATAPSTSASIINLGLGDPTHYPLASPPPAAINAVRAALESERANGYVLGAGTVEARQAVSDYQKRWDGVEYPVDRIVLTHGVGHAIDMIFNILCPHDGQGRANVLLPRPGFSQYSALLGTFGAEIRYYDCIEETDWEVDVDMIDELCDEDTKCLVIINPSNPCGSNYSRDSLKRIVSVAEKNKVPIVADEIYHHMTWDKKFTPLASLSDSVPIMTLSGLSKRFLLPGWRFGWICLHDPLGVAGDIQRGMAAMGSRFMGPSTLTQRALPEILATPGEWFDEVTAKIETNAKIMYEAISTTPGLVTNFPGGALYMLVRIDPVVLPQFTDDVAFSTALYQEEAVFVLPGVCFEAPGYFRVVLGAPAHIMSEVAERMTSFCQRHARRV